MNGRFCLILKSPVVLTPDSLARLAIPLLTDISPSEQNPDSADIQATAAAAIGSADSRADHAANSGQKEMTTKHE